MAFAELRRCQVEPTNEEACEACEAMRKPLGALVPRFYLGTHLLTKLHFVRSSSFLREKRVPEETLRR
jgi:hypothetical protein